MSVTYAMPVWVATPISFRCGSSMCLITRGSGTCKLRYRRDPRAACERQAGTADSNLGTTTTICSKVQAFLFLLVFDVQ
jgi:hypothetical protein